MPLQSCRGSSHRCWCEYIQAGTFGRGGGAQCYTVYWIASTISVIFRLIIETMMGLWPSFHRLFVRSFQKRIDRSPLFYSLSEPEKLNPLSLSLSLYLCVLLLLLMQALAPISISLCRHKTMEEEKSKLGRRSFCFEFEIHITRFQARVFTRNENLASFLLLPADQ